LLILVHKRLISGNNRVIRIDTKNGNAITQLGKTLSPAPNGLAVDYDGNLYYTTSTDNVIYKMDAAASFASAPFVGSGRGLADGVGQRASFNGPSNLIFDSSNYLYVADAENNLIRKIDVSSGQVITISRGFLNRPHDVAVNSNGLVFVADEGNESIRILTPTS
jgi:DNA-binding beta-propeller fold protein YncE